MAINCIVVDDEPRAHSILASYISEVEDLVLLGSFRNAVAAYEFLAAKQVDLVFLDINMPKIDGFTLLDMLQPRPMVILTTAYSEHAAKSYDYNAIDYLQKPIRLERFMTAVQKARQWKLVGKQAPGERFISVKANRSKQRIAIDEIMYVECLGNYAKIACRNGSFTRTLITVKELETLLPPSVFLRIHRSFIVNTQLVTRVGEYNLTVNDMSLPIGKTYKKYVEEMLKK